MDFAMNLKTGDETTFWNPALISDIQCHDAIYRS